jgi:ATP-dependent DNA helicase RecG
MFDRLTNLVAHILSKPERRWIEHKENNSDPQRIGRYVSALSNAAALDEEPFGYLIWGIEDGSKMVLGTQFDPFSAKRGNQSLEFWLAQQTDPNPPLEFFEVEYEGARLVLGREPINGDACNRV